MSDLVEAARLIAASTTPNPHDLSQRLIREADAAHRYMKRLHRPHPLWGNGSLASRALAEPAVETSTHSAAFFQALSQLSALIAQRKAANQRPAP